MELRDDQGGWHMGYTERGMKRGGSEKRSQIIQDLQACLEFILRAKGDIQRVVLLLLLLFSQIFIEKLRKYKDD